MISVHDTSLMAPKLITESCAMAEYFVASAYQQSQREVDLAGHSSITSSISFKQEHAEAKVKQEEVPTPSNIHLYGEPPCAIVDHEGKKEVTQGLFEPCYWRSSPSLDTGNERKRTYSIAASVHEHKSNRTTDGSKRREWAIRYVAKTKKGTYKKSDRGLQEYIELFESPFKTASKPQNVLDTEHVVLPCELWSRMIRLDSFTGESHLFDLIVAALTLPVSSTEYEIGDFVWVNSDEYEDDSYSLKKSQHWIAKILDVKSERLASKPPVVYAKVTLPISAYLVLKFIADRLALQTKTASVQRGRML